MNEILQRLCSELHAQKPEGFPKKPEVDLLLGNDREIGREKRSQEKRVGIIPSQIAQLKEFFSSFDIPLNVFVMQGAGQRAGYADSEYSPHAEIVTQDELLYHDRAPDVVHALKEPSKYESTIPTPFCRIGAVHGANFHADSGLADLLATRDVAIFDGSHIGAPGDYRVPIRGCMSPIAGEIAADWIRSHLKFAQLQGRVVLVGAGRAGVAAAKQLQDIPDISEIHVFEDSSVPDRVDRARAALAELTKVEVFELSGRDDSTLLNSLLDAKALLLAPAKPGGKAPKVLHVSRLDKLSKQAIVVDISIDEKGAIFDPSIQPDWSDSRIIDHLENVLSKKHLEYRAKSNMPRSRAHKASEVHGEVILPYIASLLYLAAWEGGALGVRSYFAERQVDMKCVDPNVAPAGFLYDALLQDLRNGLAFHTHHKRVVVEDIVPDRVNTLSFLLRQEIPFEVSLPKKSSLREADKVSEIENAIGLFPQGVKEFLQYAFSKDIVGSVISHPRQDATKTRTACEALGVEPAKVLKTLIYKQRKEFVAVICGGDKRVDDKLLRRVTGARYHQAAEDEVLTATGRVPGAIPPLGLPTMNDKIKFVYLSQDVMNLDEVYGSAGSAFMGFRFQPQLLESVLKDLNPKVETITREDSSLRKAESHVKALWQDLEKAIDNDDDKAGAKAIAKLQALLPHTETEKT